MSTGVNTDPMLDETAGGALDGGEMMGGVPPMMGGKRRSAWMSHVKATMKANKGMKLMQVLKMAKKTYKKRGGGGGPITPLPLTGGRRRRGTRRGTRRSRKY